MRIDDLLAQMGGLQAMAGELGMSEQQVANGAGALLPAILGGLQKQAQAAPGAAGLEGLLAQVLSPRPTDLDAGNGVLGQIFGSKEVSRAVAGNAAAQTGLDSALLKKMLPMLAMLAAGWFARQQAGNNASAASAAAGAGGLGGLGALASMLDADGNGNPLDDILRMMGQDRR